METNYTDQFHPLTTLVKVSEVSEDNSVRISIGIAFPELICDSELIFGTDFVFDSDLVSKKAFNINWSKEGF